MSLIIELCYLLVTFALTIVFEYLSFLQVWWHILWIIYVKIAQECVNQYTTLGWEPEVKSFENDFSALEES